jgi:hypothetical protein
MKIFDSVAQMKLATIKAGQYVETFGYYNKGDAGAARYLVVASQAADGYGDHTLANGTVAVLQNGQSINIAQMGAATTIDNSPVLNAAIVLATPSATSSFSADDALLITVGSGVWEYSSQINFPAWVNIVGVGSGATAFRSTTSSARFLFPGENRGGLSGGFTMDGNDVGSNIFVLEVCVEREFEDINVTKSVLDGIQLFGTQNCNFVNVHSQHNQRTNLLFDLGAGNNRFYGAELNRGGDYNVRYAQTGTSPVGAFSVPTDNRLYGPVIERLGYDPAGNNPDSGINTVYHGAGRFNKILDGNFSLNDITAEKAMIKVAKDGAEPSLMFTLTNPTLSGSIANTIMIDIDDSATLFIDGIVLAENMKTVFKCADTSAISGFHQIIGSFTNLFVSKTATKAMSEIVRTPRESGDRFVVQNAGNVSSNVSVTGESFARHELIGRGIRMGSGSTATDVELRRNERFGVPGFLMDSDTTANMVLSLGGVDFFVLDGTGIPVQAAVDGSIALRKGDGAFYVRQVGVWVLK